MKVFLLGAAEDWICDRFVHEFQSSNIVNTVNDPRQADVIWIVAGWASNKLMHPAFGNLLLDKPVILTQHHIVPWKFNLNEFLKRDAFINAYHVPCEKTRIQVAEHTNKKIFTIPFWVNQNIWKDLGDRISLRKKYGCNNNDYLIGSFQRDTEGSDLISPKLEKGPDIFCDIVEKIAQHKKNVCVVLGGWRRQYIMSRLDNANIRYVYHELPSQNSLNEMYNILDLYIVSARQEGGPQAIVECALTKTPIISTDVGLASYILAKESIYKSPDDCLSAIPNVEFAYKKVQQYSMPKGFNAFIDMLEEMNG